MSRTRSSKSFEGNDIIRRIIKGFIKVHVFKFVKIRATGLATLTITIHDSRSIFQKGNTLCK